MGVEVDQAKLLELAERCEKAEGPDRELACTIAKPTGWTPADGEPGSTTSAPWAWCPDFTASLDAAMTLVPEGWHTHLAIEDRHSRRWKWSLRGGYGATAEARAATPALALCAAALRSLAEGAKG